MGRLIKWYTVFALLGCLLLPISAHDGVVSSRSVEASLLHAVWVDGYPGNLRAQVFNVHNLLQPHETSVDITPVGFVGACGNPDLYLAPSGQVSKIVFPALLNNNWDMYVGVFHANTPRLANITKVISTLQYREEDPRFIPGTRGESFVYKGGTNADLNILRYTAARDGQPSSTVTLADSACELWGPSVNQLGTLFSYTSRCGGVSSDEIIIQALPPLTTPTEMRVTSNGVPDYYSNWLSNGEMIFSRKENGVDSLMTYNLATNITTPLTRSTVSDADPYGIRDGTSDYLFIGQNGSSYNLYYQRWGAGGQLIQLTKGMAVLGPVGGYIPSTSPSMPIDTPIPAASKAPATRSRSNGAGGLRVALWNLLRNEAVMVLCWAGILILTMFLLPYIH